TAVTCAWHASRNARSARSAIFVRTSTRRRRIAPARPARADRRRLGTFDESVPSPSSQRLCRRSGAPLGPRFFWTPSRALLFWPDAQTDRRLHGTHGYALPRLPAGGGGRRNRWLSCAARCAAGNRGGGGEHGR